MKEIGEGSAIYIEPQQSKSDNFSWDFIRREAASVKPGIGVSVHSPQLQNAVTTTLTCILCIIFVVWLEKMPVLHKPLFNVHSN